MSPTGADFAAQYDDLVRLTRGPHRQARTLNVGGLAVEFAACDDALLDAFCAPMRHLGRSAGPPDLRVELLALDPVLSASRPHWTWTVSRYRDDRFAFTSLPWFGALLAHDRAERTSILVVDASDPARLARPEVSRYLLEPLLSERGLVSVHGGTLGDSDRCVLIAARGGSGKSSLVATGVGRGLRTVGDDFLYLDVGDPQGGPRLWSAYATVKLAPSSPASDMIDPNLPLVDGKRMGWLPDIAERAMAASQRVAAIVVPVIGDRVGLEPMDARQTASALIPSSAQLSSDKPRAIRVLTALVRDLPRFRLTLAGDSDAELAALVGAAPWLDTAAPGRVGQAVACES